MSKQLRIGVAIPCYKVRPHILDVLQAIPSMVERVYVVDDCCPDKSGDFVRQNCKDPRVKILTHLENQGVGGAVQTAYMAAINDGMDIVVKIDGDGQMPPHLLPHFVRPIARGQADYTKGNRFYRPESLKDMPPIRLFGNGILSLITKFSCGYWPCMDPTNGYTAVHTAVLKLLPIDKIEKRYFFETDMLYRLNTIRAVVQDIPMDAVYGEETSNLHIGKILPEFLKKHILRIFRRYIYLYLLRDFNIGSLYSIIGFMLCIASSIFGGAHWIHSMMTGETASSGTVMAAALPFIIGVQFIIAFFHYDVSHIPRNPLSADLNDEI